MATTAPGLDHPPVTGGEPASDLLTVLPHAGLGNSAYLVDLGDGRALAVDAGRDVRPVQAAAGRRGLRIGFAADTHLHADFLSGAVQLAADGAEVLASRAGAREFDHRGLEDGDEVDLGGLTLRALGTPGHTDEHLAFLLLDGGRELGVFTGGSLLVGSAARTDLVSADRTRELARAQLRSLRRLASLPPGTAVWPTHGGGSFCTAAAARPGSVSTVGEQVATNPFLREQDEETLVDRLVGGFGAHPPYFHRLPTANRRGPRLVVGVDVPSLTADRVPPGAAVVDVRPVEAFAAAHLPGSVSIPFRPGFATWLGWLVPSDLPLVLVRDSGQPLADVAWAALEIGYDDLAGEVVAPATWPVATASIPLVDATGAGTRRVLDVRQADEYARGHLPGALHLPLGEMEARASEVTGPVLVMCGHGERAMGAASLLARAGVAAAVLAGGPGELAAARGCRLVEGG